MDDEEGERCARRRRTILWRLFSACAAELGILDAASVITWNGCQAFSLTMTVVSGLGMSRNLQSMSWVPTRMLLTFSWPPSLQKTKESLEALTNHIDIDSWLQWNMLCFVHPEMACPYCSRARDLREKANYYSLVRSLREPSKCTLGPAGVSRLFQVCEHLHPQYELAEPCADAE